MPEKTGPLSNFITKSAGLFIRKGLTGYDACYAALAAKLDGVWLTFDKKAQKLKALIYKGKMRMSYQSSKLLMSLKGFIVAIKAI
ncbi:hypothetical protein ES703_117886 [subsurface metagenome]